MYSRSRPDGTDINPHYGEYPLYAFIVAKVTFYVLQLHNLHVDLIFRIKKE